MPFRIAFLAFVMSFALVRHSLCRLDSGGQFPQFRTKNARYTYFSLTNHEELRGVDVIKRVYMRSPMKCIRRCSRASHKCLSVNFKKKTSTKVSFCELLAKNKYDKPDAFLRQNREFQHISIELPIFSNCAEIYNDGGKANGVYRIRTSISRSVQVYCDMVTSGGGWTVIQKRIDGSVNFNRKWGAYKKGFGNKLGEYWLGLDTIHAMTSQAQDNYRLRVDMEDFGGNTRYAEYDSFNVADEANNYRVTIFSFSGTAGDSLTIHSGQMFSTKDRDNDIDAIRFCARMLSGGWWYRSCIQCNPNGVYGKGITWNTWMGYNRSLKRIEFKIRPIKY